MRITERLAYDIAQILELFLTKNDFGKKEEQRLTIYLLLLLGRKGSYKSSRTQPVEADYDDDDIVDDDLVDDDQVDVNCVEPSNQVLSLPLPDIKAFQFGNPYIDGLLFRDYYATNGRFMQTGLPGFGRVDIHIEASRYVSDVLLLKPLELAKVNVKSGKPTNLHLLLERLCQLSSAQGDWQNTTIQRCLQAEKYSLLWFEKIAARLERLKAQKDKRPINKTAENQRKLLGPYWLRAGDCHAEVVEELTLLDVLTVLPLALTSGFSKDPKFLRLLKSIIASLNERYRLLRSCGLPPETWLSEKQPSLNKLEQLKVLRDQAKSLDVWQSGDYEQAWRQAFTELKAGNNEIGGFDNFCQWRDSDIGQAMLRITLSLDTLFEDDGNNEALGNEDNDLGSYELHQALIQDAGDRLTQDRVLEAFFQEVMLKNRPVQDQGGLFTDAEFMALVAADDNYAALDADALAEALHLKTSSLIFSVLLETDEGTTSPAMQVYIQHVLIEQKAAQGEGGLLNRASFKKKLALDDELKGLTPPQLYNHAIRHFASLLGKKL